MQYSYDDELLELFTSLEYELNNIEDRYHRLVEISTFLGLCDASNSDIVKVSIIL